MRANVVVILVLALGAGCASRPARYTTAPRRQYAAPAHDRYRYSVSGHDWDKLGERWVDGRSDRDVIEVGRQEGGFHGLMVSVENSAVEIFDMRVVFADGSEFSPRTRLVFGEGTRTREIDLPGGDRLIRRVEFRYGNLPGGGRAQIELWGRR